MREDIFITTKIHPRDFGYNQVRSTMYYAMKTGVSATSTKSKYELVSLKVE